MTELEILQRRLERERAARKQAENIAEQKTREIFLANEELRQLTAHLEDLVRARTAEAEAARDDALRASQAKSQFLANMSHELRTPLNAIIGYSEMLEEEAVDQDLADFVPDLRKIHAAGKHLLGLINDILDISKIEAGKMDLYLENIDLARMLHEIGETVRPLLDKNANTLQLDVAPDAGTMHSDLTKIRQILFNLLSNAIKFTDHGTITLALRRLDPQTLRFSVRDTGIGMSQEEQDRLFQAFTQSDASTTLTYGGTGLGLAICRHYSEALGGHIEVQSTPGQGSVFTLELPATHPSARPADVVDEDNLAVLGQGRGTILVIDDDGTTRDLMRRFLGAKGFRVETAANGIDGLRRARELRPHAITLDVMMPGMDGWAVLTALKQEPDLADIPVIMLTIVDGKSMGFALGAADYLTKPIDRARLHQVLERHKIGPDTGSILLVEDDDITRRMMRSHLDKAGLAVIEAADGEQALRLLETAQPALVLLDLMMPVLDGFGVLARMRQDSRWRHLPVVVITAKELSPEERAYLHHHVERILQKGALGRDELLAEVHRLITQREGN